MTELERTKRALDAAVARLQVRDWTGGVSGGRCEDTLAQIAAILNPPPEMETVEVVRWAKMAPTADGWHGSTWNEAQALEWEKRNPGCKAVKMVGTYERPVKRPVVKEVSVDAILHPVDGSTTAFRNHPECHGKTGTLIFRYTE